MPRPECDVSIEWSAKPSCRRSSWNAWIATLEHWFGLMGARPSSWFARPAVVGGVSAAAAFCAVVLTIDAAGDYPSLAQGPGLTIDEPFNVQQGVRLAVFGKGWILGAITTRELFGDAKELGTNSPTGYHLPDHPPLGRLWLGLWHQAVVGVAPPHDHDTPFVTSAARVGSAAAFALTVLLVGMTAARWYGPLAGWMAAASLALTPHVFGHAHIAALETCMNLAFLAAVLAVASKWTGTAPPSTRTAIVTGIVFGLALLTKIQAVFLPPAVGVWALMRWRWGGVRPVIVWGLTGVVVLFVLWPWLWPHPIDHFLQYLGRTTDRVKLHVWYLGRVWDDRDVPWHYPWVMFLGAMPLAWLAMGAAGVVRKLPATSTSTPAITNEVPAWRAPREQLLLLATFVPMVVFSIPGVAVYDGDRLFLVAYPLWSLLVGRACATEVVGMKTTESGVPVWRRPRVFATAALLASGAGVWSTVRAAPCWLNQPNGITAWAIDGDRPAFEASYWGDGVTRELLTTLAEAVPPGSTIDVVPVLHDLQLKDLREQCPALRKRNLKLRPLDLHNPGDYLLTFERRADLPAELPRLLEQAEPIAVVERYGSRVAGAYRLLDRPVHSLGP